MRRLYLLKVVVLSAMLPGCAGLNRTAVPLDHLADCPKPSTTELSGNDGSSALIPTQTLACKLNAVRNPAQPSAANSLQGSRLCLHLAEREANPGKRESLSAEGVAFAESAIKLGADGTGEAHYYLAANLGLAVREHPTLALQNLPKLESEMKRALALSPEIDDGGPMRLLGMLYLKAPAWPSGIGDIDKGLDLLQQAAKKFPNHPLNHLFYAQAIKAVDDKGAAEQALAEFNWGLKLLHEGQWGYRKDPWQKEFAEFQSESRSALISPTSSLAKNR